MNVEASKVYCSSRMAQATAWILSSAIVLQILCGGVRFVDGSILLQFSQNGFEANIEDTSQFLFDSPLKVLLLRGLHLDNAVAIGLLFLALNLLPLLAILLVARNLKERLELLAVVSIMPMFKLMFQNVGVGDSVVIAGTIVLVAARHWVPLILTAYVIVLWHFQQGVLIVSILFALSVAMRSPGWQSRIRALAIGSVTGVLTFAVIQKFLVPPHLGRLGYVLTHMAQIFHRNLLYLPIALCPMVPGVILMIEALQAREQQKQEKLVALVAIVATVLAVSISALTIEFSRVMLLLTFPVVLFLANPNSAPPIFLEILLAPRRVVPLLAIGVVTPFFSWSGIDVFLWTSLRETFQKYLGGAL